MTFFVSAVGDGGEFLPYVGKVFEAGEYPDKSFAISASELSESALSFEGVDLDLEHSEFRDLLGHRLGRLEKLWIDGRDAIGRLSVPRWLHELSGGRLQTSLTFDRSKRIVGCALTLSPRIADAEVVAAFSLCNPVGVGETGASDTRVGPEANPSLRLLNAFGVPEWAPGASYLDRSCPHPTLSHGAREPGWLAQPHEEIPRNPDGGDGHAGREACKEIEVMPTSLRDRLKVLFRKTPQAFEEAGIDAEELEAVEFASDTVANVRPVASPPDEQNVNLLGHCVPLEPRPDADIATQLAEFKATNDRLIAGQLHTCAALFADSVIRDAKAVPAQREQLIGLYKQSAIADGSGTVRFSTAGQPEEGANLRQLKELFANAQPHSLFNTEIPNADPNEVEPDKALIERLRGATALGQATVKKEAK